MKKPAVHLISSALLRPNGISRYIEKYTEKQSVVRDVIIFCDSKVTFDLPFEYEYKNSSVEYEPNIIERKYPNGSIVSHPWLQVDKKIVEDIRHYVSENKNREFFAHDAMSALACFEAGAEDWTFIQHESEVINPPEDGFRLTYLSDEWYELHIQMLNHCTRAGLVAPLKEVNNLFDNTLLVETLFPLEISGSNITKDKDVLLLCDSSYRKGWDRYEKIWNKYKFDTTVISWENDSFPEEWDVKRFELSEQKSMINEIARHKVVVIPSRVEATCLALLESLNHSKVYVFDDKWTEYLDDSVNIFSENDMGKELKDYLESGIVTVDRSFIHNWVMKQSEAYY